MKTKKVNAVKPPDLLEVKYYKMLNSYLNAIYREFNKEINLKTFSDADLTKEQQLNKYEDGVEKVIAKGSIVAKKMNKQLYSSFNRTLQRSFNSSSLPVDLKMYYHGDKTMLKFLSDNSEDYILKYGENFSTWLKTAIRNNYLEGGSYTNLQKEIRARIPVEKRKAKTIARNETSTFTSVMNKKRADDLGVEEGEWQSSEDERVRSSHRKANGKVFNIDKGLLVDGEYVQPGQPINCRCWMKYIIKVS